ncbi:MAG TPA: hypothetical protein VFZ23_09320 [Pyrinomonadaceae bacterium]
MQQARRQQQQQRQRVYTQPRQNWGQIRREQAFEAKRYRDSLKAQRKADRQALKFERKQQHFESKAFRQAGKDYQRSIPYSGDRTYRYDDQRSIPYSGDRTYSYDDRNYSRGDRYYGGQYSGPVYRENYSYRQYPQYPSYGSQYPYLNYEDYPLYTYRIFDYDDDYDRYYYSSAGYDDFFDDGLDWKSMLFRSVIAMFFSNGDNIGYYDQYPQYYDTAYYDDGYYDYGYASEYSSYPYYTFGYEPAYAYYEPAAYYGYDQYAYQGLPYEYSVFSQLPYGDMVALYSGTLEGELIQRALGTGYYQGLLEGQMAREQGWGDEYYHDPYLYQQAMYDPYSSSIGDCRRYFSEGYEMGYQDALAGRDEFDLADRGGDVDLVSLILGSVLDFRG